jgi:hypothetical protein
VRDGVSRPGDKAGDGKMSRMRDQWDAAVATQATGRPPTKPEQLAITSDRRVENPAMETQDEQAEVYPNRAAAMAARG